MKKRVNDSGAGEPGGNGSGGNLDRLGTGVEGLDAILHGGLPRNHLYVIVGPPGTGKTTLGLQFLMEGERVGEKGLYVTFSQTRGELAESADSMGFGLNGLAIFEDITSEEALQTAAQNTLFYPSEVELSDTTRAVLDEIERIKPRRVVVDALSEMRLLAQSQLRYRQQIVALKQFFLARGCTTLMLDDPTVEEGDTLVQSLSNGVIELDQMIPASGRERRHLLVRKMRDSNYIGGYHDMVIQDGGMKVYSRVTGGARLNGFHSDRSIGSGIEEFDSLMGGGMNHGTVTFILGPTGSGKSTLASHYVENAINEGEKAAIFIFEEGTGCYTARSRELGLHLDQHIKEGRVILSAADPMSISPGEFAWRVRQAVEDEGVRLVVLDSYNGYFGFMANEQRLENHMQDLLNYLGRKGIVTILTVNQPLELEVGSHDLSDFSYLPDALVRLMVYESEGEMLRAVCVLKSRHRGHSTAIHEFKISPEGILIGKRLREMQGVLTREPRMISTVPLMMTAESRQQTSNGDE